MTIRLCILQAGEHSPKMPEGTPGYRELFTEMFAPHEDIKCGFVEVRLGEFPKNLDAWDAFLITGSAAGVYDSDDWISDLRNLIIEIDESGKPLVGICFGHQIIADTLGGKAVLSHKGWGLGRREVKLDNPPEGFTGNTLSLLYVHRDQVTTPPEGAKVFAGDAFCPVAGYTVDDRILSIQGHPEFTSKVVDDIMDLREDDMGEQAIGRARADLDTANDATTTAAVIAGFIRNALGAKTSAA